MIHIVFEVANIAVLQKSFELDPSFGGEIICIQDDYAVGPVADLYTAEGQEVRLNWWREVLAGGSYEGIADDGHVHDNEDVRALRERLGTDENEVAWIWAAQNKHDVSGYYWLMSQLKDFQGRVFILYLNNLPFINEKGNIFYPTSLFQIQPKEYLKAKKLARPITLSEFEIDPDEWTKLANESRGIRLLEGGKKLVQKDYDYYDDELLKYVGKEWLRANKVLNQFLSKAKETTGDAYILWRIRQMIDAGKLVAQGDYKNMKEFEIKVAAGTGVEAIAE